MRSSRLDGTHPASLLAMSPKPKRPEFSLHCERKERFCLIKVSLKQVRKLSEERGKSIDLDRA